MRGDGAVLVSYFIQDVDIYTSSAYVGISCCIRGALSPRHRTDHHMYVPRLKRYSVISVI